MKCVKYIIQKSKAIKLSFFIIAVTAFFIFLTSSKVTFAGQSCPLCDGQVGKQRCLDNTCQTSCYPAGLKCDFNEGHCANGSCSTACCNGQKINAGQVCIEDSIVSGDNYGSRTTICLDPGHGGATDPGSHTVPDSGQYEADWTITVANDLEDRLKAKGYRVVRTRARNGSPAANVKLGSADNSLAIRTRTKYCYDNDADLMYRIHFDGGDQPQRTWHIIPNPKMNQIFDNSKKYGEGIQRGLVDYLGPLVLGKYSGSSTDIKPIYNGGVVAEGTEQYPKNLQGSLEAQELGNPPVVLAELLTFSTEGVAWLKNGDNYQKLIDGIVFGFLKTISPDEGGYGSGKKAVAIAKTQLGKPYVFGTPTCTRDKWNSLPPPGGCPYYDCSKFTDWAWYWASNTKIYLYAYTSTDWTYALKNPELFRTFYVSNPKSVEEINNKLKPGDLLYIGPSGEASYHVVMYAGNNTIIHAPNAESVVRFDKLSTYSNWSGAVSRPTP